MLRVHAKLMSGPKMARFQQNIRKVSEKKMGRDTNSPVAANGFCTVSEPNCVRLSWIDHTGAGHTNLRLYVDSAHAVLGVLMHSEWCCDVNFRKFVENESTRPLQSQIWAKST